MTLMGMVGIGASNSSTRTRGESLTVRLPRSTRTRGPPLPSTRRRVSPGKMRSGLATPGLDSHTLRQSQGLLRKRPAMPHRVSPGRTT